ncbi:DUF190 domain-containing protein [Sphingomonas jaspsi]|uniref:DUF190 domain-containing protein n=1 Tax=Sphingomonas jaspsi TaxID=392409 RepID=UPI0004B9C738|nr:DUF190 domain-containing protein [Sphingomonas jaspsi]
MNEMTRPMLHLMKKIEVVVQAADIKLVETVLRDAGIAGWTMIRDVAGMGHHGFHQGRTIFSDESGLVMFVGVAPADHIRNAADNLRDLFHTRAGVLFMSDVEVIRSDYFVAA